MLPTGWASSRWLLQWLFLCISSISLTAAQNASAAVSTLFVPDTNTVLAFNIPPGSSDVNFYVLTPDWYQYTAFGFGNKMSDSLMLVFYASEGRKSVTVSPRKTDGHTEPVFFERVKISVHEAFINANYDMVVNATCHNCLRWSIRSTAAPMIFAVGPALDLSSDDKDARIRRHSAYGFFTVDFVRATGSGNIPPGVVGPSTKSSLGATLTPDSGRDATQGGIHRDSSSRAAVAHGVLFAIAALAFAPLDILIAGALGPRWAWMHAGTATVYFLFVIGAFVPGILVSSEHVMTKKFLTGHQILGFITVAFMVIMYVWGAVVSRIKRGAKKRGQEPPEGYGRLAAIHRWVSRLVWLLLLVNVGLGMKLSEQRLVLILAYLAVALAIIIILVPVYFCIWKCTRHRRKREAIEQGHEMPTIYDHNYYR